MKTSYNFNFYFFIIIILNNNNISNYNKKLFRCNMIIAMQFNWRQHEVQTYFFTCPDRILWVQRNHILQLSAPPSTVSGTGRKRFVMWRHSNCELQRDKPFLIWIFHSYFESYLPSVFHLTTFTSSLLISSSVFLLGLLVNASRDDVSCS